MNCIRFELLKGGKPTLSQECGVRQGRGVAARGHADEPVVGHGGETHGHPSTLRHEEAEGGHTGAAPADLLGRPGHRGEDARGLVADEVQEGMRYGERKEKHCRAHDEPQRRSLIGSLDGAQMEICHAQGSRCALGTCGHRHHDEDEVVPHLCWASLRREAHGHPELQLPLAAARPAGHRDRPGEAGHDHGADGRLACSGHGLDSLQLHRRPQRRALLAREAPRLERAAVAGREELLQGEEGREEEVGAQLQQLPRPRGPRAGPVAHLRQLRAGGGAGVERLQEHAHQRDAIAHGVVEPDEHRRATFPRARPRQHHVPERPRRVHGLGLQPREESCQLFLIRDAFLLPDVGGQIEAVPEVLPEPAPPRAHGPLLEAWPLGLHQTFGRT
mmetsp:Transcript_78848/g.231405  ORF Transcript_78848/g.231405 Transcript_78848/m.231405 type:complete len:388 (-) Transcript_78848:409-1572(-)